MLTWDKLTVKKTVETFLFCRMLKCICSYVIIMCSWSAYMILWTSKFVTVIHLNSTDKPNNTDCFVEFTWVMIWSVSIVYMHVAATFLLRTWHWALPSQMTGRPLSCQQFFSVTKFLQKNLTAHLLNLGKLGYISNSNSNDLCEI